MRKSKKTSNKCDPQVQTASVDPSALHVRVLTGAVIIAIAAIIIYLPCLNGGFVLDDNILIANSPFIRSADGLYIFWCTNQSVDYWPATNSNLWIDWRLWNKSPAGYHAINLLLHIVEALLIWVILRMLSVPGAFLAALIFALHPVNAESVAWISQRKNMMAMLFFLLSILWYLKAVMPTASAGMTPARSQGGPGERDNSRSGPRDRGIARHWLAAIETRILNVIFNTENTREQAPGLNNLIPNSQSPIPIWYWLSLAAFLLAMLSKGSTAVLPVLLLGIAWWRRRRGQSHFRRRENWDSPLGAASAKMGLSPSVSISPSVSEASDQAKTGLSSFIRRDLSPIIPFFLIAAILTGVNVWFQSHGAEKAIRSADFVERLLGAGCVPWFYLYKAIFPVNLCFVYPQWDIKAGVLWWWLPLAAALVVTAVLWIYRKGWGRPVLFAWGFFCMALVPVMGFIDVGYMKQSLVADRYQHIAIIGVIALAAAGIIAWYNRARPPLRRAAIALVLPAAGILVFLTMRQSLLYCDAMTLYQATLEKNPASWMAYNNLGVVLVDSGRFQDAIANYQKALQFRPNFPEAENNLGNALIRTNRPGDAIEHFQRAIQEEPDYADAHNNMGFALFKLNRPMEAISRYRQAIRLKPDYAEANINLGFAMLNLRRPLEAMDCFRRAMQLNYDYAEAQNGMGLALIQAGRHSDAIPYFQQAMRLRPDYPEAHCNMGVALVHVGQLEKAIEYYNQAIKLKPNYIDAINNQGNVFRKLGQYQQAMDRYQQVLALKPDFADVYFNLAMTFADMNQSSNALAAGQKALELAREQAKSALAKQIEDWLNSYRAKH
jgi:tetratricopeptide (TPR) repeat protein